MSAGDLRPVDAARLTLGAVALVRPQLLIRVTGSADGTWPRRVTRILGGRYVAQSAGGALVRDRWVPALDGGVDLVHAVSMVGFALVFPAHRRLAVSSGVAALGFAAADLTEQAGGSR
jgi:hypothetical protein